MTTKLYTACHITSLEKKAEKEKRLVRIDVMCIDVNST